jgi:hypothetical protein
MRREEENIKDAEKLQKKSLGACTGTLNNYLSLAFTLYEQDNKSQEAEILYKKALELTAESRYSQVRHDAIVSIAFIHLNRGDREIAKRFFLRGVKI